MANDWKITYFKPDNQGVAVLPNGFRFAAEVNGMSEAGLILYQGKKSWKYPFSKEGHRGSLYGIEITGEGIENCSYHFYHNGKVYTDSCAYGVSGLEVWGDTARKPETVKGKLLKSRFDWESDVPLMHSYEDSVIYGLNVRAYTMHKSSGVKKKGTFEGLIEKIPYFNKLGITAIELMPCYEYDECLLSNKENVRMNCWGFQEGYYFSPKASYSGSEDGCTSFKTMVRELHRNDIEVIMQFYFPKDVRQLYVLEVLKYWVKEYHVDGFRICGYSIPFTLLVQEPVLTETKLWFQYLPEMQADDFKRDCNNLAIDHADFKNTIRRFIKGDEGMLNHVLQLQRMNPKGYSVINYLADYDGFSLFDYVSYERKHNEANGEENRDGSDVNYSWNCGYEGITKRKSVLELRKAQIKNAISLLLLSQGVPFLFGGDEFCNTRYGNNNAYCQDNETGWVKWSNNSFSREILEYTCSLIKLRKEHSIFHMSDELRIMDTIGCGFPDLSYHGKEAWRPDLGNMSRTYGMMFCGRYAAQKPDYSFYIACNMHWEAHALALPRLPKENCWVKIFDTKSAVGTKEPEAIDEQMQRADHIQITGRSIMIFQSRFIHDKDAKKIYVRKE